MPWDWGNFAIVMLLLAAVVFVEWADRRDQLVTAVYRMRLRRALKAPVGSYRFSEEVSIRFGRPDSVVIFGLPLDPPGEKRSRRYAAITDDATRFLVGGTGVDVDGLLEAYDDGRGALVLQVAENGRVAEAAIDTSDPLPGAE